METTKELYREAMKLFRENNLEEAILRLEKAVQADPAFVNGYEALGEMYMRSQRLDEALNAAKKFCELAPDDVMAHTNLSRMFQKKGMIKEAEDELMKAKLLSGKKKASKVRGFYLYHQDDMSE